MAMNLKEIEALIKEALPDAKVEIEDLAGDGNHYSATVSSSQFSGKNKIDAIVTKIGPPKVRETTSANGRLRRPKKIQINAIAPEIALNACRPGLVVL